MRDPILVFILLVLFAVGAVIFYGSMMLFTIIKKKGKRFMRKKETTLSNGILNILTAGGYKPTLEHNNTSEWIEVKIDGKKIHVFFEDEDPNYMRITHQVCTFKPNEWIKVMERINRINKSVKFVCLTVSENDIFMNIETILYNDVNMKDTIFRYIDAILFAYREFWEFEKMNNINCN